MRESVTKRGPVAPGLVVPGAVRVVGRCSPTSDRARPLHQAHQLN
jgi:hypothetical protein